MKILDHLPVELSVSEGSWVAACLTGFLLSIYETDWMNMHKGPIKKNGMYLGADFLSFVSSIRAREVLRRIMMCIEQGHWFVNPLVKKIPCKKKHFHGHCSTTTLGSGVGSVSIFVTRLWRH